MFYLELVFLKYPARKLVWYGSIRSTAEPQVYINNDGRWPIDG